MTTFQRDIPAQTAVIDIPQLAAKIEALASSEGDSAAICHAIGCGLRILVSSASYRAVVANLLANPLSDRHALALIARIKRDVPILAPLDYGQMGVYIPERTEVFADLSAIYLSFGNDLFKLGTPTCTAPENTTLN